jgi:hypothetical protein
VVKVRLGNYADPHYRRDEIVEVDVNKASGDYDSGFTQRP